MVIMGNKGKRKFLMEEGDGVVVEEVPSLESFSLDNFTQLVYPKVGFLCKRKRGKKLYGKIGPLSTALSMGCWGTIPSLHPPASRHVVICC